MAFLALKNSCENTFRPIKKFDDLAVGTYTVDSFRLKDTKFGRRIFVNIEDFCVVLPPRFLERISTQNQIDELNSEQYKMIYAGKDKEKKNLLLLNFVEVAKTSDDGDDDSEQPNTSAAANSADEADGASTSSSSLSKHDDEPSQKRKRTPKKFF